MQRPQALIYLGLGSNCGDRRAYLTQAINLLAEQGFNIRQISPVVESPALLMPDADPAWNKPYLNCVLEGESQLAPTDMLALAKSIEQRLGRDLQAATWSPRNIDIDILLWHEAQINLPALKIPHPEMYKRAFVITPLMQLAPDLIIPGMNVSLFEISQSIKPIPLWMGIVNLTPDSFSDGGEAKELAALEEKLESWINAGVHIIDMGAESTRPNAAEVSQKEEWQRLKPAFKILSKFKKRHVLMPIISLDTRHAGVAKKGLKAGANWINDVSGLANPAMQGLIHERQQLDRSSSDKRVSCQVIAMHSLSVPADPNIVLDASLSAMQHLMKWLEQKTKEWQNSSLDLGSILIDPGIGFGKNALQNSALIKASAELRKLGHRIVIGHSRKSFMNNISHKSFAERDIETLGLSLAMCEQGVDILRVHDPLIHIQAYRAWAQARR